MTKKSALELFPWKAEDPYPKHYFTPQAGKPKPYLNRLRIKITKGITGFILDVFAAIKAIIREVM